MGPEEVEERPNQAPNGSPRSCMCRGRNEHARSKARNGGVLALRRDTERVLVPALGLDADASRLAETAQLTQ
jgi:hypothetical protein